ncbi:Isocitrate/Isopropylmalate dehydrogenase-like protein [Cenococcum geophilum 1.58]|uniref:Isocitrate/Isopropylmalate dehydrogenase-like protein n=1 Tax=Cenococcum geophilum 1.58 TaxID=794803 RepID=UPI00358E0D7C|nr:Isocitrate/Isopropylmalate dehydrogenase-like protein [Cenococcum geophilum 1.58]
MSPRGNIHKYRIASIPADGIGLVKVVNAAIECVKTLAKNGLDTLRQFDAGLFGSLTDLINALGHISLWCLLLAIRRPMQLFANTRPVRSFPKTQSYLRNVAEGDIDWILPRESATEVAIFTRVGIERIMWFAFETAQSRPRKLLPVVTKSNSMRNGMVLWDEVAAEVVKDFLGVKWDKMLVDAMTVSMVHKPQYLDTVVGTNLHMDILSGLAAALAGSIGVAFEPIHGSAFDMIGKGIASPVATIWLEGKYNASSDSYCG